MGKNLLTFNSATRLKKCENIFINQGFSFYSYDTIYKLIFMFTNKS